MATLLRKLSYKSTMNFGKYPTLTTQQIIDVYGTKGKNYLVWCYYHLSNITFLDNILDDLCIDIKERILKPSKFDNSFVITNKYYNEPKVVINETQMLKKMRYGGQNRHKTNKAKLQARNHGR
jgi:hypothetical protein